MLGYNFDRPDLALLCECYDKEIQEWLKFSDFDSYIIVPECLPDEITHLLYIPFEIQKKIVYVFGLRCVLGIHDNMIVSQYYPVGYDDMMSKVLFEALVLRRAIYGECDEGY